MLSDFATSSTTNVTKPSGLLIGLLRAVWFAAFVICAFLLLQAIPVRFESLRTPGNQALYQLDPSDAALLAEYSVSLDVYAAYNVIFELLQIGVFALIAVLLFGRLNKSFMGLLVSLTLLITGVMSPATVTVYMATADAPPILSILQTLRYALTIIFVFTFPDGKLVTGWARWILGLWVFAIIILYASGTRQSDWSPGLQAVLVAAWLLPGLLLQRYRYRISTREQKQQVGWFIYGIGAQIIAAGLRLGLPTLFPILQQPGGIHLLYTTLIVIPVLDTAIFLLLPLSIAVSITQYNLWSLNLTINRTIVYGLVFALIGFLFFLAFFSIQGLVQLVGGAPELALVVATALTVALIGPAIRRTQHFIDRRVFRLRLDLNQLQARRETALVGVEGMWTGRNLSSYAVQELIGQGGMGQVYKARHTLIDRTVAIKVLSTAFADDPEAFRQRFEREARTVASLRHPNIVEMFDFGVVDGTHYMIMEYVPGQDLSSLLKRDGGLGLDKTRRIVREIANALDYAHAQGIIHRDIKPSNVILRASDGMPILLDFGIAKIKGTESGITYTGMLGTLEYAAPEQIMSARSVEAGADIYALGVMTYHMLAGEVPFKGSVGQLVFAHLQEPAPDLLMSAPSTPPHVAAAVQRCMAKNVEDRYPTAGEFAEAICAGG
jgi:tRNA A-37 threonylcarbamoyl transferase component Bud32